MQTGSILGDLVMTEESSSIDDIRTWSLKLIIIGQPSVGKTSLRRAYLGEKFRINYIATIGADFSFKQINLGKDHINTSIWDLAGQEETFANIHPQYYKGSAGALVVYDVTNYESFESVGDWIEKYQSLTGEHKCPILVVGNKIDLLAKLGGVSEEEQEEMVQSLRERFNHNFPILSSRTSAKTGSEINESFRILVSNIVDWQKTKVETKEDSTKDMEEFILSSYLLTFHDMYGPKILVRSISGNEPQTDKEFASAIKISSILDFDDVIKFAQVTGTTPWTDPEGMFYYIAFTIDNKNARGGKSLFICGFVVRRDIREIISQSQHIIDGILHSAMNDLVRILVADNLDLTSDQSIELNAKYKEKIRDVLLQLKEKIFAIIKNKV